MGAAILEFNKVGGLDKEKILSLFSGTWREIFQPLVVHQSKILFWAKYSNISSDIGEEKGKNKHQSDNGRLGSSHMRVVLKRKVCMCDFFPRIRQEICRFTSIMITVNNR